MTIPRSGASRMTEAEWRDIDDLRKNWGAFCDADPFDGRDTFIERMEARGYIHIRPVRKYDLEKSFSAQRGIEPGGNLWELTAKGRKAIGEKP
jgi:hypothetical protein